MIDVVDVCVGEPSYGTPCPHKLVCAHYNEYNRLLKSSIHKNQDVSYISAFYCSSKDWHKFKKAETNDLDPFVTLSNNMIIRHSGKSPKNEMEIYRVVVPEGYAHSLLYDGVNFFRSKDDNLLEPDGLIPDLSIKTKEINEI